jgi:hypothetical protein
MSSLYLRKKQSTPLSSRSSALLYLRRKQSTPLSPISSALLYMRRNQRTPLSPRSSAFCLYAEKEAEYSTFTQILCILPHLATAAEGPAQT